MELSGTIQGRGALTGSFDFDQADYNMLKNKPSINGVELVGNKTSQDLHINSGGGGGGTNNYNDLENKPKINGVILQDELSLHSLGIQSEIEFSAEPTEYLNGNGLFTTPPTIPDYQDTEYDTGRKYNNKNIWERVIKTNLNQDTQVIITGIDEPFKVNIYAIYNNRQYLPLNYYYANNDRATWYVSSQGELIIETTSQFRFQYSQVKAIIEYTKI